MLKLLHSLPLVEWKTPARVLLDFCRNIVFQFHFWSIN